MSAIGSIISTWRYPVKGMRGEQTDGMFLSYSGVYGDRVFAFRSSTAMPGFPYHTAREQEDLLLYQPKFRYADKAAQPPNLAEAVAMAPGITPVYPEREALAIDVIKPDGAVVPIDDEGLLDDIRQSRDDGGEVTLVYSERPQTDCRPISLFSQSSALQIGDELGMMMDVRRFRPNLWIDLDAGGFAENALVGKNLRIGERVVLAVLERDPRCKMISLDPETGDHNPRILQHVTQAHEGHAGLYAAVLTEGIVRPGDRIELLG
jgi:uncharacterized protein YcbX